VRASSVAELLQMLPETMELSMRCDQTCVRKRADDNEPQRARRTRQREPNQQTGEHTLPGAAPAAHLHLNVA